jgi:hypothetical protein
MSDATTIEVNPDALAEEVKNVLAGTLATEQIDAIAESVASMQTAYPATGSVASMIFYLRFQVNVTGGKSFNGNGGGIASPGGGANFGHVYTDDINRLYSSTKSFAFTSTPVYFAIYFFDGDHNALGSYQAGAVSIVTGTGGGTGSWS